MIRKIQLLLTLGAATLSVNAQTPSPLPLPNPYRVDETFKPEIPSGLKSLASVSGLKVGPDNNLYVFHRCVENTCTGHNEVPPILVYTQKGALLRSVGAGMVVWPHGIFVTPDRSIWATD